MDDTDQGDNVGVPGGDARVTADYATDVTEEHLEHGGGMYDGGYTTDVRNLRYHEGSVFVSSLQHSGSASRDI